MVHIRQKLVHMCHPAAVFEESTHSHTLVMQLEPIEGWRDMHPVNVGSLGICILFVDGVDIVQCL